MDSIEIDQYIKNRIGFLIRYKGIYTSDEIGRVKIDDNRDKPLVFVVNTLKTSDDYNIMGHWVCFYVEKSPFDRIIFFDSFGINVELYCQGFRDFLNINRFVVFEFNEQYQLSESYKCGLYVLFFIHYTSIFGIKETLLKIKNIFSSDDKSVNDKYVTRYFVKNIEEKSCNKWKGEGKRVLTYNECKNMLIMN